MGKLGTMLVDPEMPDTYESFMAAMLLPNIKSVSEFNEALSSLETLAAAAQSGATVDANGKPISPGAGIDVEELEAAQTWQQNTADWWDNTWSGDFASGSESFSEGWDAFWSGQF
jgi:hypothetical protein